MNEEIQKLLILGAVSISFLIGVYFFGGKSHFDKPLIQNTLMTTGPSLAVAGFCYIELGLGIFWCSWFYLLTSVALRLCVLDPLGLSIPNPPKEVVDE